MGTESKAAAAAKAAADAAVRQAYANLRPVNAKEAVERLHERTLRWVDRLNPELNLPHFKPGLKQVHFPNFYVQLLRSRYLPPNQARFRVSRSIGKLDLRDFLWHGYGVRAFNIRSSLKYQPIEDFDNRTNSRRIFRRQPIKFMTIEMHEPFYWPEEPTDLSPWDKKVWDYREAIIDRTKDDEAARVPWQGSDTLKYVTQNRKKVAEQAKALLSGEVKWEPTWQVLRREVPGLKRPLRQAKSEPAQEQDDETSLDEFKSV